MHCDQLAAAIIQMDAELSPAEVARLCLLIYNHHPDPRSFENRAALRQQCKAAGFRLKAAADQHAAMAAELDALCGEGPQRFSPEQLWTLVRAIKVQSQVLELYTGEPALA